MLHRGTNSSGSLRIRHIHEATSLIIWETTGIKLYDYSCKGPERVGTGGPDPWKITSSIGF